jgi:SAM-dependent methyltransferase
MFKPSDTVLYTYAFHGIALPETAAVLDVGCQHAGGLKWIKERYHLTGQLVGIDKRGKNFEDARTQAALGITLLEMNAAEPLDFPDESFDLIFHKDTLECIPDIPAHIAQLHRVLKPGGVIVCVHRDWESLVFNGQNKALINKVIHGYANFQQASWMDACDGWIGRRIWGHFNKTGLFSGNVRIYNSIETEYHEQTGGWQYIHDMNNFLKPTGFLTKAEYEELLRDMEITQQRGEYLCMSPYYIYQGRKRS